MKKINVKIVVPIILVAIVIIGIILVIPKGTTEEKQILSMIQTEFEKGFSSSEKDFKEIIKIDYDTIDIQEDEAVIYGETHYKNLYGREFYAICNGKFKINRDNKGDISSITTTYLKCGADIMIDVENNINRIK